MIIFDRRTPQVQTDATNLTQEQFIEKYKNTSASTTVLESVYKNFEGTRKAAKKVIATTTEATEFPEVEEEDEEMPPVPEKQVQAKVVAMPKEKVVKEKKEKVVKEGGDKPGRTPRMRELMKEHGTDDKQKIKRILIEEGFNTDGSGFHSEWNRVKTK